MVYSSPNDHGILKVIFSFPSTVNEPSVRLVAGMVLALSLVIITTGIWWLIPALIYGFLARVLAGPTLSPMALLATRVLTPQLRFKEKVVAGRPKQFAQGIGLIFSTTALVLFIATDSMSGPRIILGILSVFALLESGLGFCAGCFVFIRLMAWGFIPESICKECVIMTKQLSERD